MFNSYDDKIKEFISTYHLILENSNFLKPNYIGLNMFKIVDEWAESPDLLEFPKELQIELCKNLRKRFDNIYILSFKKIIEILEKYDYEYVDDVKEGMQKFNIVDRGYLLLISVNVDENIDLNENKTLKFIKENFNDVYDNAYSIFSNVYNNRYADGLTILHRDEYDPENTYNCIYVNRKSFEMKDTLEHELTHFIRNVAKYNNRFPKTYSNVTTDKIKDRKYESAMFIGNILKKMNFSESIINSIEEIAIRAFTDREEQPTIKSIVNLFIRRYETDKEKYEFNHLMKSISQIEGSQNDKKIDFRLKWLNDFLSYVNSYRIFEDNRESIEKFFSSNVRKKDYRIEIILKCISYLCFKEEYQEYDIDKIITENFKKFKFRDV